MRAIFELLYNKVAIALAWSYYCILVLLVGVLYPILLRLTFQEISWNFSRRAANYALNKLGIMVETIGLENINGLHSAVVIANHRSWFDSLALASVLPLRSHFTAKKEYFKMPLVGLWFRLYQLVPIDYCARIPLSHSNARSLLDLLKKNRFIVSYPEGTRSRGKNLYPFKQGPWWIAAEASVPLIEAYITGSDSIWPKNAGIFDLRPGTIKIEFKQVCFIDQQNIKQECVQSQASYNQWQLQTQT